jgi:hypothetical protein
MAVFTGFAGCADLYHIRRLARSRMGPLARSKAVARGAESMASQWRGRDRQAITFRVIAPSYPIPSVWSRKNALHEFNDINLNDCWLGARSPVSAGTSLSQHVDELRNHWSGYRLRLPGGAHRYPRSVLGRQIAENHILGGYLLQRLADHRHPKPRCYKGERARGAVRFLDDLRLETRATASFQKPIAVIRVHTI